MKVFFTIFLLTTLCNTLSAQTLFTYGKNVAGKDEFLKAFNKNYQGKSNRDAALKEYLELYIRFKLKVQAAYDMHLDTLASQRADLNSFRQQLETPYLTDQKELERLTREAFDRSQKDIRLSQIIIPFRHDYFSNPNPVTKISAADSAMAHKKIVEVNAKLKNGGDFEKLVQEYSADPNINLTKGDLGFITVFTLPYEMENIAYSLALNKYSQPFASKIGYHIFKKTAERPAAGRIKASQILLAFEPSATGIEKDQKRKLADSLYNILRKGSSFEQLAKQFSNDKSTYINGGHMPEFGVGQFEPAFENAVFSLKKDGELSKPIQTSFGYHLVKRESHIPVVKTKSEAESELRQQVQSDSRSDLARLSFEKQLAKIVIPKKSAYDETALWKLTDSFHRTGKIIPQNTVNEKTILFTFPNKHITTTEWIAYFANTRGDEIRNSLTYPRLMQEFVIYSSTEYYRNHLEDYSPEFRNQFNEFKEGNLLFEIMERKVWTMAGNDSAGLKKYYTEHKQKYQWGKSADALLFNATDEASAKEAANQVKQNLNSWKKISNESDGRILADSGRFELSQLSLPVPGSVKAGQITPVQVNQQDNSASFTYIIRLYSQPSQRSFEDARGLVMNDYQNELEEKWIAELKAKYPVQVNENVFQSLLNKK
jgi:peptidyl-prolyl cis-trans isomerase SurA